MTTISPQPCTTVGFWEDPNYRRVCLISVIFWGLITAFASDLPDALAGNQRSVMLVLFSLVPLMLAGFFLANCLGRRHTAWKCDLTPNVSSTIGPLSLPDSERVCLAISIQPPPLLSLLFFRVPNWRWPLDGEFRLVITVVHADGSTEVVEKEGIWWSKSTKSFLIERHLFRAKEATLQLLIRIPSNPDIDSARRLPVFIAARSPIFGGFSN